MAAFGTAIGGGDVIKEAMARRGLGVSPMSQQSPAAPTFSPVPQSPTGAASPMSSMPPTQSPTPGATGGLPLSSPESQLIIKALDSRLKSLSKQEEGRGSFGV